MSKIAVITDSSAYLPPDLVQRHDVHVIPQVVLWGSQALLDGVDIAAEDFHRRLSQARELPTTTQPNPDDFLKLYETLAESYCGILAVLISSQLSGTVNSAKASAEQFDKVPLRIVDTLSTSMGLGLPVLAAARAAQDGCSLEEAEQVARAVAARTKVVFVVDTLEFLHRGGRIGGAARLLGTALQMKPLLHLCEGRVDALERVRTNRRALNRMLDLFSEEVQGRPVRAAVMHADSLEPAKSLRDRVAERFNCLELHITDLSPAIAAHVGPGTLALAICPQGD